MARPAKNYIVWRNGSATVRIQVPAASREAIGKRELLHTLGKVSKWEAANLSLPLGPDPVAIALARSHDGGDGQLRLRCRAEPAAAA